MSGHRYRPGCDGDPYCADCGHEPWMRASTCPGPHRSTPTTTTGGQQ